jgi:hypothetical protein
MARGELIKKSRILGVIKTPQLHQASASNG